MSSYSLEPVTELDGTISRESFTILNNAGTYTEDQQYNIYTFSSIYSWLLHLYKNKTSVEGSTSTSDLSSLQSSGGTLTLDQYVFLIFQFNLTFKVILKRILYRIV